MAVFSQSDVCLTVVLVVLVMRNFLWCSQICHFPLWLQDFFFFLNVHFQQERKDILENTKTDQGWTETSECPGEANIETFQANSLNICSNSLTEQGGRWGDSAAALSSSALALNVHTSHRKQLCHVDETQFLEGSWQPAGLLEEPRGPAPFPRHTWSSPLPITSVLFLRGTPVTAGFFIWLYCKGGSGISVTFSCPLCPKGSA